MRLQELDQHTLAESSGYSLAGSYTPDLVYSKLWLAQELERCLEQQGIESVPVAYVLGSWYGNMSTILRKAGMPIEQLIDVEKNQGWLATGRKIQRGLGINNIQSMQADANKIHYQKLQDPGVIINASTNDIADQGWFDHIPAGTIVALQGRDAVSKGAEHIYHSPEDLLELYPLEKVLYQGSMQLRDPETEYTRHMVIGIKGTEQLRELTFMGMSQCTKDCSGHQAGYTWSKQQGGVSAASWSPSFNKGAEIASQGY
jgi:hypothetical protein